MALQNYFSDMRRIAYDQTPGNGPGVFFLGGFNSNKEGTKALALEDWAKIQGRAYMRFDYSGCLLYTSPSPRDLSTSRMPSSA